MPSRPMRSCSSSLLRHSQCAPQIVDTQAIEPDAPFADYNLDSLTVAELMFEIDDTFHVVVPDEAATTVTTLNQLAALTDRLLAEKAPT